MSRHQSSLSGIDAELGVDDAVPVFKQLLPHGGRILRSLFLFFSSVSNGFLMISNLRPFSLVYSLAIVACLLAGCGSDGPPKYQVSGEVTFDGKPVEEGQIIFTPTEAGVGPDAGIIKGGKFSFLSKEGDKKVSIEATREVPGKTTSDFKGGQVPLVESYIPARYNKQTKLEATVSDVAADNKFEFDLTKD
ncbi:MAG: signal peptide-containing protein [Planctomycetaceae bacterium]|nr:signal peptide-containing protein [Planctomycetaceae bacterium]